MSKTQTRKSISVTKELAGELHVFATEHGISQSQVVTQAIRAIIRGDIPLEPAQDAASLQRATKELRGQQ